MADWWTPQGASAGKPAMPLNGAPLRGMPSRSGFAPSASAGPAGAPTAQSARDLDFTASGAGLANAGINERNMIPRFEKLRGVKDEKAGGSRQLWKNLDRWENTPQGAKVDPEQKRLFDLYHRTGTRDPRLKNSTVAAALDWGVREGTRSQMHKENFFDSGLGRILGTVGQVAASFIPVVGPYVSMGIGALHGGLKSKGGGWGGALTGAASGYGIGKGTQWLSNGAQYGFGALNNVNAFMPGDIAARAGSGTANTAFSLGAGGRAIEKGASLTASALRRRKEQAAAQAAGERALAQRSYGASGP